MPSADDYAAGPRAVMLQRLRETPVELDHHVTEAGDAVLGRRPEPKSWSATEIVCHLRDVEGLFQVRFHTIVALEEPTILVVGATRTDLAPWRLGESHPLDPDRWAEERQYERSDARAALRAFQRRRGEVLRLLNSLSDAEWQRGGIHPTRGRRTLTQWVASLAGHDDNHLGQLGRALEGRP
jgi:hypothetical protein